MNQIMQKFHNASLPKAWLLGVNAQFHELSSTVVAQQALEAADVLQGVSGARIPTDASEALFTADKTGLPEEDKEILVFVRCRAGSMSPARIRSAAKILGYCDVRCAGSASADVPVRGRRAVVCPQRVLFGSDTVPFLVSRSVWFNANRVTVGFPAFREDLEIVMADINARLSAIGCEAEVTR